MSRKLFVALVLSAIIAAPVFSVQTRLSDNQLYGAIGDGAGKAFYLLLKAGSAPDLFRISSDGTGNLRLTSDNTLEWACELFPGGTKLAAACKTSDGDSIVVMNTDGTGKQTVFSSANYAIKQIAVSPSGLLIAFAADDVNTGSCSSALYVINADGTGSPQMLSAGISGGIGAFSVHGASNTRQQVYEDGRIAFSSDSTKVSFVSTDYEAAYAAVDGSTVAYVASTVGGAAAWIGSGTLIYGSGNNLCSVNYDGSGYAVLLATSGPVGAPAVSPDGTKYAFSAGDTSIIVVSSMGVLLSVIPMPAGSSQVYVSWVANDRLVYTRNNTDLVLVDSDGTDAVTVASDSGNNMTPVLYGAGGGKILYSTDVDARNFYTMNTDGSGAATVLGSVNKYVVSGLGAMAVDFTAQQSLYSNEKPQLSPDGTKVAYTVYDSSPAEGNKYKLYVAGSNGANPVMLLANNNGGYTSLAWSKTGAYVMFASSDNRSYIITPDGAKMICITPAGTYSIGYPVFSPNDGKVAFILTNTYSYAQEGICVYDIAASSFAVIISTGYYGWLELCGWEADKILMFDFGDYPNYRNWVVNSDGTGLTAIAVRTMPHSGKLSPAGTWAAVVFDSGRVMAVKTDGSAYDNPGATPASAWDCGYYNGFGGIGYAWSPDGSKFVYTYRPRNHSDTGIPYVANADGSEKAVLNSSVYWDANHYMFAGAQNVVYIGDGAIWAGDFSSLSSEVVIPESQGEMKVVLPEGISAEGAAGTIDPDTNKPVSFGFKGNASGNFTMRIYTQLGELVYEETKAVTSAEGWFDWIPGNLSNGVYLVSIEGPGMKQFKKIAILR